MNALIIGCKGFIGENLALFLSRKGIIVWGADVSLDYTEGDRYFLVDATNSDYHLIFEAINFDICINCSGAASVPDSLKRPLRDFYLNTSNVFKLLNNIRKYQPNCKYLNLSSAAVYGNPESLPIKEEFPPMPVSPYGYHKLMSEQICKEFYHFFEVQTCSLRIFSAYGDGLRKQLFWDLYQKTRTSGPISLFGTGRESRDFIYVKDLVNAIYLVALKGEFNGQIINVANGEEVFIEDAVAMFYSHFDTPIKYKFSGEGRRGDPNNWLANIEELRGLGYKQQYDLKQGLANYFKWIKATKSDQGSV